MASKEQVAVADIVKTLLATNQRLITKKDALQRVDQVFRQAKKAEQILDQELAQAYKSISPVPEITSSQRSSKRQKTDSKTTYEQPGFLPPATSSADEPEEVIRCVCNSDLDNGALWICCEKCSAWQHTNCMRLPWTAEEAEKQKYLCEKCAPAKHWEVLIMLREGTWDPLPFKNIEDDMDQREEEAGISKNKRFHQAPNGRNTKAGLSIASPNGHARPIPMVALQQGLQDARSTGNLSLVARIADDIRKLENIPSVGPFGQHDSSSLQSRGLSSHDGYNNREEVAKTVAARSRDSIEGSNQSPTSAGERPSATAARDRRHSISGGVGADILLPANARGPVDDKQRARAQEPYKPSSNGRNKGAAAETSPAIDPTLQQLARQAARKNSG